MRRLKFFAVISLLFIGVAMQAQSYDEEYFAAADGFHFSDSYAWMHTYKMKISPSAIVNLLRCYEWNDCFSGFNVSDTLSFKMSDFIMDVHLTDHVDKGLIPLLYCYSGLYGDVQIIARGDRYRVILSNIRFKSRSGDIIPIERCEENPAFPELFNSNFKKLFDLKGKGPSIIGIWELKRLEILVDGKVTGSGDGGGERAIFKHGNKCIMTESENKERGFSYNPKTKMLQIGQKNRKVTKLTSQTLVWESIVGNSVFRYTLERLPQ